MSLVIDGQEVPPNSATWIDVELAEDLGMRSVTLPIRVINGSTDGPTLWVQAMIHGDEIVPGVALRDFLLNVSPEDVEGTIIGIPVTSLSAFENQRREPPMDGKDPIRNTPPHSDGTRTFTDEFTDTLTSLIIKHADYVIDLHTTGYRGFAIFPKSGDEVEETSREIAEASDVYDAAGIDLSKYQVGLWTVCAEHGIPSITTETGGLRNRGSRINDDHYQTVYHAVENVAKHVGILRESPEYVRQTDFYEDLTFVFANTGGILETEVSPETWDAPVTVSEGDRLATISDLKGNVKETLEAPHDAKLLSYHNDGLTRPGIKPFMMGR